MKKFKVFYKEVILKEIEIEAEDVAEAKDIVIGGDFDEEDFMK